MSMYQGKAALARTLEPQPVRPAINASPWGRVLLAYGIMTLIAALTFWSTT